MPVPAGSGSSPTPAGLSYDPVLSRVRLSVQVPSSTAYALVERSTDELRWSTVRGAEAVTPTAGGVVSVSDYEFAADVPNFYRVRAFIDSAGYEGFEVGPAKTANPYFEVDASGWSGNGGTVARSTAQAHEGLASLLLTPDGVTSVVQARATNVAVTAGNFYVASGWLRSTVARTAGISIIWRDAGGAILSQTLGATVSMSAGVWTYHEVIGQAPAGSTQATFVGASMSGTPPTSNTMHIDEAYMVVIGGTPVWSGSITPVLAGVWLKNVARPFLNRQVVVVDYSDVVRPARAGVFDVVGRSYPVAVSDVRGSKRWTLEVLANSVEEADDLALVLAGGDNVFVHVPAGSGIPGGYVLVGDVNERRTSRRSVRRVFELPLTEVAAPGPDVIGSTVTCQSVLNAYMSVQAMLDAQPTIADLMELIGDPTDVVVP